MLPVIVRCFPKADRAFARKVAALMRDLAPEPDAIPATSQLEARLRVAHPEAVVSQREQLAHLGVEFQPLWYVFRDGGLAARSLGPRRVLVLDDDDAFAEMLEAMLLQAGFVVRRARDGAEGFDVAATFAPNVILLDLKMPRSSGEEFADRYRQVPDEKAQIIVVSGLPDAWKRAQATEARAVLRKPFEMDALLKLVHHLA
ncbi:MAG: response regulator [Candidatus Limnocylindrales bacterium]